MARVKVGLVGCGFVAELHMYAYQRVYGVDAQVRAVAARGGHVVDFAKKHRIHTTYRDFHALLADLQERDATAGRCTPRAARTIADRNGFAVSRARAISGQDQ